MDEDSDGGREAKGPTALAFKDSLSSTPSNLNFREGLTSEINYDSDLGYPSFPISHENPIYKTSTHYERDVNIRSESFNSDSISQLYKFSGVEDCDISASTSSDTSFSDNSNGNVSVQRLNQKECSSHKYDYSEVNSSNSYLFPNKSSAIRTLSNVSYPSDLISNDKMEGVVDNRIASNKRRLGNIFSVGAPAPKIKKKRLNVLESKPLHQISDSPLKFPFQTSNVTSSETLENFSHQEITEPINSPQNLGISEIPGCKANDSFTFQRGNVSQSSEKSGLPFCVQSSNREISNIGSSTLLESPDLTSPSISTTQISSIISNIDNNVSHISKSSLLSKEVDPPSLSSDLESHVRDSSSLDNNKKIHSPVNVREKVDMKNDENSSNSFINDERNKLNKLQDINEVKNENCDNRESILREKVDEKTDFTDDDSICDESDELSKRSKNLPEDKFVRSTLRFSGGFSRDSLIEQESYPDYSLTDYTGEISAGINNASSVSYHSSSNLPPNDGEPGFNEAMSNNLIESRREVNKKLHERNQSSESTDGIIPTLLNEGDLSITGSLPHSESSNNISSSNKNSTEDFSDTDVNFKSKESSNICDIQAEETSMSNEEFKKDNDNDEIVKQKNETLHSKDASSKDSKSTDENHETSADDQFKRLQQKRPGATGLSAKPKVKNLRRNIREIIGDDKLEENTLAAQKEEQLRLQRLQDKQQALREYMEQQQV